MSQLKITLPLPSRNLSPNARVHWTVSSRHKKIARRLSMIQTFAQVGQFKIKSYRLDFYWPNKRRRDKDNACASCKSYLDGVADCMEQDDSEWDFDGVRFHVDVLSPRLEIVIEAE